MTPFFSVVIPTYNAAGTIRQTLKTVCAQFFKSFEIILVDDGSEDQTTQLVEEMLAYVDIKHKIIKLPITKGVSNARNIGIKESQGQYIAFLDSDDTWMPEKLEVQFKFIEKTKARWLFSNYSVMDTDYNKISVREREAGIYDYKKMISNGNPVGLLTVAIQRSILEKNLFYNVPHEDYELWLRLARKGVKAHLIDRNLAGYMKKRRSVSSNKIKAVWWTYSIYRMQPIRSCEAIWLTVKYLTNTFTRISKNS